MKKRCGDRREKGLTHKKGTKSLFAASSSYFTHKKPTLVLHQPLCKCSSSCGLFPFSVCKQCCCTAINQKCPPSCAPSVCAFVCVCEGGMQKALSRNAKQRRSPPNACCICKGCCGPSPKKEADVFFPFASLLCSVILPPPFSPLSPQARLINHSCFSSSSVLRWKAFCL